MSGTYTYYDFMQINVYIASDYARLSLFIEGDGVNPITASGLYITQGSVSIPVTCLGKSTFVIPPMGRQCDSFNASSLTLPGTINIPVLTLFSVDDYIVDDPEPPPTPPPGYIFPGFEVLFPNLETDFNKVLDCEFTSTVNDSVSGITPSTDLATSLAGGYLTMTSKTLGIGTSFTWTLSDNDGLYAMLTAPEAESTSHPALYITAFPFSKFPFHHDSTHGGNNFIKVESTATATMDNLVAYITNYMGGMDNDSFTAVRNDLTITITLKEEWCISGGSIYGTLSANAQPSYLDYSGNLELAFPPHAIMVSTSYGDTETFGYLMIVLSYPKLLGLALLDWYNIEVEAGAAESTLEEILAWYAVYKDSELFAFLYTSYVYTKGATGVSCTTTPILTSYTDAASARVYVNNVAKSLTSFSCGEVVTYNDYLRIYTGKDDAVGVEPAIPVIGPRDAAITSSEASFTLTVNPTAGDTVTLHLGGDATVLTFTAYITGVQNIIIGEDLAKTIDNIVEVINGLPGAVYQAVSSSYTVTVTAYSDLAFYITTSITTATVTDTDVSIRYLATVQSALPMMYATASIVTPGEMPILTISASATPGNGAAGELPLFTSSALAYPSGTGSDSSDDEDKVDLLMPDNDYIETLAEYLFDLTGTDDEIALQAARWVSNNITYTADVTDTWNNAVTTLVNGYGDCEDGAILQASLMLNSGVDTSRVRVYIGTYMSGATTTGHAWLEYRRQSDNQWVALDWTKGAAYWNAVTSITSASKTYPDEIHHYIDGSEYITYANVVTLEGDDYVNSLIYKENIMTLPLFTLSAADRNHGGAACSLPVMTATAEAGNHGSLAASIPILTASGLISALTADLNANLPLFTILAVATNANRVTLLSSLPVFKISGEAYQVNYGIASASLPRPVCSAAGYPVLKMVGALELPMIKMAGAGRTARDFDSFVVKHEYDVWAYVKADLPLLTISAEAN